MRVQYHQSFTQPPPQQQGLGSFFNPANKFAPPQNQFQFKQKAL